jgi:hypothetical protein
MRDDDRFKLSFGPYHPPRYRVGDKLACEYRGREVVVGGITGAPDQRPYVKKPGRHSCVVCGDLIRAARTESEVAVAHPEGVPRAVETALRDRLEVGTPA